MSLILKNVDLYSTERIREFTYTGINVQKKLASIFILSLLLISVFSPFYTNLVNAYTTTYTLTIKTVGQGNVSSGNQTRNT